jgi:hypothetical protein
MQDGYPEVVSSEIAITRSADGVRLTGRKAKLRRGPRRKSGGSVGESDE